MQPWEKRPDETAKSYAAFVCYLELGRRRSLLEAYRRYAGGTTASWVPGYVAAWSSRHEWVARSDAYDVHHLGLGLAKRGADLEYARQRLVGRLDAYLDVIEEIALDPDVAPMVRLLAAKEGLTRAGVAAPRAPVSLPDAPTDDTQSLEGLAQHLTESELAAIQAILDRAASRLRAAEGEPPPEGAG